MHNNMERTISPTLTDQLEPCIQRRTPPKELDELSREIAELKRKLNAVILAHNYQDPEIQDIADYVGDSLGLARQAAKTNADVIVFCGVHFMAETAKILNPDKLVLLPDEDAGCSLEESCPADQLAKYQEANPGLYTIAYINCSAAVKALSDVICTSGNAELIVRAAPPDREILFVPDQNLGSWVMERTGRKMRLWPGECMVHVKWTEDEIRKLKERFPDAKLVAHPECIPAVRRLADEVCSTEKMVDYCKKSSSTTFIVATEPGMIHRLQKECPNKRFIAAPAGGCRCNECKYMKLNTLRKVYLCMRNQEPHIELDQEIMERARQPIERMLEITAAATTR